MNKLSVSASPHAHSVTSTREIMRDVLIALMPAAIVSVVYFGFRAALVIIVSVAASVLAEYITRKILKRSNTISDLSAAVTGLLIAFNVPSTMPIWAVVIGDIIAIVIVKQFFGGIGQNFVNPAITARIILMTSFPLYMNTFTAPFTGSGADAITTATPLATVGTSEAASIGDLFLGLHGGTLGEVCCAALLVGFIYLLVRQVVSYVIPVCFIGTVAVIMLIAGHFDFGYMLYEVLAGGLFLGAFFMATDYTTSPVNTKGRIIFGIGCGLITSLIRLFGSLAEGVSFSIILMNILVPHIENLTAPTPFGVTKPKHKKAV